MLAVPLLAQQPAPAPDSSGRFLLLVDTSLSMRRRAVGTRQAVESLLASDLDGRLKTGDTIGLWTFNEDAYMGRFPLQTWSPAARRAVTDSILDFLKSQRYQKKTDLDKVLARVFPLVRQSPAITLVLFSDGDAPVRGTPFDDAINAIFRDQRGEQQRSRAPFVTVLRAEGGRFVNYAVGLPPWPVKIPLLPGEQAGLAAKAMAEPTATKANTNSAPQTAPAKAAASMPKPPPAPQPLIMRRIPAPAPVVDKPVTTSPPPAPDKAASPSVEAVAKPPAEAAKVEPAVAPADKPGPSVAVAAKPDPGLPPNVPAVPAANVVAESSPPPPPSPVAGKVLADAELKPAAVAHPKPPVAETPAATTPAPVPSPPAPVKPIPPTEAKTAAVEPAGAVTTVKDATAAPAKPPETTPVKPLPAEVQLAPPVAAKPPGGEAKSPAVPLPSAPETAASIADAATPVQTALVSAPPSFFSGHRLLGLGLLLLAAAGGLLFLILRRSRAPLARTSLITQSLERDKDKPPLR